MAQTIMMVNPATGVIKKGFFGFSWTTLFFGGFPAIFRGDILTGVLVIIADLLTGGLAGLIWAFVYNKKYTLGLIEEGYQIMANDPEAIRAREKLGII